ncbi:CBS domain-containing protein [Ferrovibrio sp.]|uniref:CBS domain-containing protein n=1 Tax=Ferrovibrio sp. TaxID=1917215 RepID=UPI00311EFEDE
MKVADIMTPRVETIPADATVGQAIRLMLQKHVSGLPVVDAAGKLVGMITEGDFLRRGELGTAPQAHWLQAFLAPAEAADAYTRSHARKVGEVMTADVISVDPDEPLEAIVKLMEKHRVKRLPVLRDGRPVGVVSRADLLRAFAGVIAETKPATSSDAAIRAHVLAEMQKQPWAPTASVNVIVRDGVVHLWGSIFQDSQRAALHVLAENAPGARGVRDHLLWLDPMSGMYIESPDKG